VLEDLVLDPGLPLRLLGQRLMHAAGDHDNVV
jgi:hypothetical protein